MNFIPLNTPSSEDYFADSTSQEEELIELYMKEAGAPCFICPVCGRADIRNIVPHMSKNHRDIIMLANKAEELLDAYEAIIKKWNLLVQFVHYLPKKKDQAFQFNYLRYLAFQERYFQLAEINKPALGISPYLCNVFNNNI